MQPVSSLPDRSESVALLESWVDNENLRRHMYCVEAAVRHYARLLGGDEDLWGTAALLHDLDWEKHPEEHPLKAVEELRARGYPNEVVHAILAHRPDFTGVEPSEELDRVLYACDELSGLVYATCLMRPTGIDDLTPRSVTKKLKDKAFAAGVDREQVATGVELIGLDRAEHIQNVIDGMRAAAEALGIRGEDMNR
jgi:putative nucleotidyltransferase with HDIG domain